MGLLGLTHFGQLPHVRHNPVLRLWHRGEVPALRLDCEVRIQRQVQLLWLLWFDLLLCLLFFETDHLCKNLKPEPSLVDLLFEGFEIRLAGEVKLWNVRSVLLFETFHDALPGDSINSVLGLRLNLALFPCCDELSKFSFVGESLGWHPPPNASLSVSVTPSTVWSSAMNTA